MTGVVKTAPVHLSLRLDSVFAYKKPEGSYLIFPMMLLEERKDSTVFCLRLLKEGRVSATPEVASSPTGESHLRLSFCASTDGTNKACDRIEGLFGL